LSEGNDIECHTDSKKDAKHVTAHPGAKRSKKKKKKRI
jgi:hypothetical protein